MRLNTNRMRLNIYKLTEYKKVETEYKLDEKLKTKKMTEYEQEKNEQIK